MRFLAEQSTILLLLILPVVLSSSQHGPVITPYLPFMLYGSDNVAKIRFSEAPCVFVAASPKADLSDITFTGGNLEGTSGSTVAVDSFVDNIVTAVENITFGAYFGAYCFPDRTTYLDVHFKSYSDVDRSMPEWQSTIFYFMSKEMVEGPCSGTGTQKRGGNVFVLLSTMDRINANASSECPAVFLAPSNIPMFTNGNIFGCTVCAGVKFQLLQNSEDVDVFTVQNGVMQIEDPFIFRYESLHVYQPAIYLRNAILLRTSSQEWIQSGMELSYANYDDTSQCTFGGSVALKTDTGRIDSNPYGTPQMQYGLVVGDEIANMSVIAFSVSTKNEDCMTLQALFITGFELVNLTNILQMPRSFTLSSLDAIRFYYNQLNGDGCSSPSSFAIEYRFVDTTTTSVAPTTKSIPTTTTTPSATPRSSSRTTEKSTTKGSTTTEPRITPKDDKCGAMTPQFFICSTLSALLLSCLV